MAAALALAPVTAQAESLREALTYAYTNNPDIASALLSVKSTAEGIVSAKAGKRPQINASATYSNSWSFPDANSTNGDGTFQLGASLNQNIFDSFRSDAQIEQARALTELSTYTLANAEQNVLLSVAQAYMNVIRDTQLVQLRQENVSFFEAQVRSAQDRLDIGEGTRIEVSQAQARLAQATASYRAAVGNLQISQASYQRWVGRRPQNLSSAFDFNGLLPNSIDTALSRAENDHPALLSAKAAIRVSQAGADAASSAFGPTLDLIGSLCAINCFGSGSFGTSASMRLTLSIPIYAGGAMGASMRKANLELIKSEVDALSTRDQIRESVISAWSTLQTATAQIESAQASVNATQLVVQGTIEERDVGESTTLDVLNAQSELTTARESLISAQTSRVVASFSLVASTGKLSAQALRLPVNIDYGEDYIRTVEDVWVELRSVPDR